MAKAQRIARVKKAAAASAEGPGEEGEAETHDKKVNACPYRRIAS